MSPEPKKIRKRLPYTSVPSLLDSPPRNQASELERVRAIARTVRDHVAVGHLSREWIYERMIALLEGEQ